MFNKENTLLWKDDISLFNSLYHIQQLIRSLHTWLQVQLLKT